MAKITVKNTGIERKFEDNEIIVSKTNKTGKLTYVNDVFVSISGFSEEECLGQPHSMIRHPDMPRCIFKLLWDTITGGNELFAYVLNNCKNGDHYWVLAHVTPSRDSAGAITGFHSNRRTPSHPGLEQVIIPLYKELLAIESRHSNPKEGLDASYKKLTGILAEKNISANEFALAV